MSELTGRIIKAGDPGWDRARKGFAAWAPYDDNIPFAIVFCACIDDVIHAVQWARENGRAVRVRSGRHSYEAYSSLVKDGIIIDLSDLDSVSISQDHAMATVCAGVTMVDLYDALNQVGATIPLATARTVGISGLVLGGGFGVTSRKWGLTCDSLSSVMIVLADGTLVEASSRQNSDLLWACCGGGGGNFGIVVSFTFNLHPVGNVALFTVSYAWSAFESVVDRFQNWIKSVDDGFTAFLALLSTRCVELEGQYTAYNAELDNIPSLLAPMLDPKLSPNTKKVQIVPHTQSWRVIVGLDPSMPQWRAPVHSDDQIFKSSSAFVYDRFPSEAIAILKKNLETVPNLSAPPSQASMIQLLGGGGQAARRDPASTAAFHRMAQLLVQYDAYWTAPQDSNKMVSWIEDFRTAMSPYTRGAYVNYVDELLTDPLGQYFGPNLPKLMQIKRKYDPDNFFSGPQNIPVGPDDPA